jgi:hypothetical protein
VKILYTHINERLKSEYIEILPDSHKKVCLFDYFQIICPLESVLLSEQIFFKGEEKFKELRDAAEKNAREYVRQIVYIIYYACYAFCDLNRRSLYTFTYEHVAISVNDDARKHQIVTLGLMPLDVRRVKIDRKEHTVCLVGEVRHSRNISTIEPVEVPLRRLKIPQAKFDDKAPVYIQQYAIDRITECAYCTLPGIAGSLVYQAFTYNRKIIPTGENQYLIECYCDNVKTGYFSAIYVSGILVIRTFLLITHSDTPEGRKLEQLTGLQKLDKAYLAIDNLFSLANSNIVDDDEIQKIFKEAGCKSILKLCRKVRSGYEYGCPWDRNAQSWELSKMIFEYIQLGAKDEEYFENSDN